MKTLLISVLALITPYCNGQRANYEDVKNLYDQGKSNEAINLASLELKKIKLTDSLYEKIIKVRVDCYMNVSEFKSAISDYELLIRFAPKNTDNYSGLAYAYWAIEDDENSMKSIRRAHKINPNDALTLSNMAYYYGQAGKIKECIGYSNKGLALNNLDSTLKSLLLNNRAFGYLSQQQYDKASVDTNESIALNSNNSYAYCYRALANIGLKKMDIVCQDLEMAKKLGGERLTKDLIEKHCGK